MKSGEFYHPDIVRSLQKKKLIFTSENNMLIIE